MALAKKLSNTAEKDSKPWWKYGYVWLVISGPSVVVVAGFYTLWLAISSPNPILTDESYRREAELNKIIEIKEAVLTPAMNGRNHAATPALDRPSN